ncbi:MAG: 7-carboxy-7-deazaguanine synthase QueE [Magnetococcales bacterium]|nr:7-carboxy-7-deazaguanine synthase QueE [Magnetococcales bacterium]
MSSTHYPICDLFTSIQGEGGLVGMPFVFLRFWGCPLSCPWCDEPRHRDPGCRRILDLEELLVEIQRQSPRLDHVLLTGGEPLAVPHLDLLVSRLKERNCFVAMETSGVGGAPPPGIDWITLSPKTPLPHFPAQRVNEVKFVLGEHEEPAQEALIQWWARHPHPLWLQPRWQGSGLPRNAVRRCLDRVLAAEGRFRLSLQIHKWLDIP